MYDKLRKRKPPMHGGKPEYTNTVLHCTPLHSTSTVVLRPTLSHSTLHARHKEEKGSDSNPPVTPAKQGEGIPPPLGTPTFPFFLVFFFLSLSLSFPFFFPFPCVVCYPCHCLFLLSLATSLFHLTFCFPFLLCFVYPFYPRPFFFFYPLSSILSYLALIIFLLILFRISTLSSPSFLLCPLLYPFLSPSILSSSSPLSHAIFSITTQFQPPTPPS